MKNKLSIDWKKALIFLIVSAGLVYITKSIWMSIGIVLVLFIIDGLLANWEYRRKTRKIFDELKKMNEERKDGDTVHD
ncbi:MAG: hypothetical protein I3J02_11230 [Prevotella sp.]|nr:hypothetical protein [Prevotella sp.]